MTGWLTKKSMSSPCDAADHLFTATTPTPSIRKRSIAVNPLKQLFFIACVTIPLSAAQPQKSDASSCGLDLDFTLFDLPYQNDAAKTVNNGKVTFGGFLKGYANPSMHQSLSLTATFENTVHFGIDRLHARMHDVQPFMREGVYWASLFTADALLIFAPPGDGWLHEEYHRAVMTRHHVNSFDDMNTFPIGNTMVSVKDIDDADLVRFKKESSADFIRMHVAGIEGEYLLMNELQKDNFFNNRQRSHEFLYLVITLNSIAYVFGSTDPEIVDKETDNFNRVERKIKDRDFTGFDFSAWAYDIFRPDEPYEIRGNNKGIHPTGTGIDRYIKTTDLTDEELSYLKRQSKLHLLNCISPMFFFKRSLTLRDNLQFNFAVRHLFTSFGNDISLITYFKNDKCKFALSYHHANNYHRFFPAFEGELIDYPFTIKNISFSLTPRALIGIQPDNQSFTSKKPAFLGLAECRADIASVKRIHPWIALTLKTPGWIAGNEFLEGNVSVRSGLQVHL